MDKSKVELVEAQRFTINVPGISAPVTVGAECNEIVVLVRLTLRPRDNVMNVDLDVSAGRDGATMSGLDENASADFGRYWRTSVDQFKSLFCASNTTLLPSA